MIDLAFYNAGCHEPRGLRRGLIAWRRLLRRLLRPIFLRLADILQHICNRLDDHDRAVHSLRADLDRVIQRDEQIARHLQAAMSFGWDYVAMTRRLAILEDRVEALTAQAEQANEAGPRSKVA
ncbi:MAG TPA: hypothetical protein VGZ22_28150 [Isosphaeraceae bacterium]|jgi:hypothetical protein|nr:hypothetical protein [Isosphaeraceae bacterium]